MEIAAGQQVDPVTIAKWKYSDDLPSPWIKLKDSALLVYSCSSCDGSSAPWPESEHMKMSYVADTHQHLSTLRCHMLT